MGETRSNTFQVVGGESDGDRRLLLSETTTGSEAGISTSTALADFGYPVCRDDEYDCLCEQSGPARTQPSSEKATTDKASTIAVVVAHSTFSRENATQKNHETVKKAPKPS